MSFQALQDFYMMGPVGKLGAYNFKIARGFIFDSQRKYVPYFRAFLMRGKLRLVNAEPTHIFKEGDFRPIKFSTVVDGSLKEKIKEEKMKLPKPLQKMSKTYLSGLKKPNLSKIARSIGIGFEDTHTRDQLIALILTKKNEMIDPLPDVPPSNLSKIVDDVPPGMVAYDEEDMNLK